MTNHESSDSLTPLRPERIDIIGASEWDMCKASEWVCSGLPGIEDVDGAARSYDHDDNKPGSVFVSDLPTTSMTRPGKVVR